MSARTLVIVLAVLAVIGLLGFGLVSKGGDQIAVGDTAPDKELTRLVGAGSGDIADYRGRWVLINFWASWCGPCRTEAPALERFQRQHSRARFTVLGINLNDNTDDATAFVQRYGLTYPQLREGDGRDRQEAYGMTGFPESFLVDPQGRLALIRRGPVDERYLNESVEPLIRQQS
jgi:cytochrome c biogenesis protein CcmG/thiol:disulfide interchange protein DsbE